MNQKAYSILFCALLASTFIHEIRSKDLGQQHHHNRAHNAGHIGRRSQNRDNVSSITECTWVCSSNNTGSGDLKLIVNVNASIIAVYNSSSNVAVAIDIHANVLVLFNGETGTLIAVNLETQTGVYLTSTITTSVWLAAKISFSAYISQLTSLSVFLTISGGVKFDVKTVSKDILKQVGIIVGKLISGIQVEIDNDASVSIKIIIQIAIKLRSAIVTYYEGSLTIFENGKEISITFDFSSLVNIIEGVGTVIKQAGGITVLLSSGFRLDIDWWSSGSGSSRLINLLLKLHYHGIDIGAVFGEWLNNSSSFFILIAIFGGNSSTGESGIATLIALIIARLQGSNVSIEEIISRLLVVATPTTVITFSLEAFFATLEGFSEIIKLTAKYSSELKTLSDLIVSITTGQLIIASINISTILIKLEESINAQVENRLAIIFAIGVIISAVPTLILAIFIHIATSTGKSVLQGIGIEISSFSKIIAEVVAATPKILLNLATGNITAAIKAVATFNSILSAIEKALIKNGLKLANYIGSEFIAAFKAILSVLFNVQVSASSTVTTTIQALLKYASFSFAYSIDVHYQFSAGGKIVVSS